MDKTTIFATTIPGGLKGTELDITRDTNYRAGRVVVLLYIVHIENLPIATKLASQISSAWLQEEQGMYFSQPHSCEIRTHKRRD
jgi:hypothetical protein